MKIKNLINKYSTFLKYLLVAGLSFFLDITIFTIMNSLIHVSIILSTIIARIISSLINYLLNKDKVFKGETDTLKTIFKYYLLVILQMFISAFVVNRLYIILNINASIIKIPVELFLFICNYLIQKLFIFKRSNYA